MEDEGEQAIASIDLPGREKKKKKTVKRVRFMEPDESEAVTEEGATSTSTSTSTTSSSSSGAREHSTDDVVRKRSRDGAEEGRALLQGSVGPDDDVPDSTQAAAHGTPPKRVRFFDDDSSSPRE